MDILTFEKLGDNVESGTVANILVKVDDEVAEGDLFLELETDKAVIEILSPKAGRVKNIFVKKGDVIKQGDKYIQLEPLAGQTSTADVSSKMTSAESEVDLAVDNPEQAANNVQQEDLVAKENVADQSASNNGPNSSTAAPMQLDFLLPQLGENIDSVKLTKLSIKEQQTVDADSIVAELESDKASLEVNAPSKGIIKKIYVSEGAQIKPGDKIFMYETLDPVKSQNTADDLQTAADKQDSIKNSGLPAQDSQGKAAQNLEILAIEDKPAASGTPLNAVQQNYNKLSTINASPHVRRFAREIGIDISMVAGSGTNQRISVDDVKNYAKQINSNNLQNYPAASSVELNLPDFSAFGPIDRVDLNAIKKATVKSMTTAWQQIPLVTNMDKADITSLEKMRQKYKKNLEKSGLKLTMTAILVKLVADLLTEFTNFNASFDHINQQLIIKKYVNIGIAVDTPQGLMVPVIKDAPNKKISQLAKDLAEYSKKARDRKLKPDDISGATFTISNIGGIGGNYFTPIVNWPQVSILGVAKSSMEPLYNPTKQEFEPKLMMPLALSYDHRVIDGAEAARFLSRLVAVLQDPFLLQI